MKKLIFLRDGHKSWDLLSITTATNVEDLKANAKVKIAQEIEKVMSVLDVDIYIQTYGYKKAIEIVNKQNYDWFITTCPTILHNIDWWSDEEQKFEIYIPTEKGKLKNIQEFTEKELRQAHNVEKMFLGGYFDD